MVEGESEVLGWPKRVRVEDSQKAAEHPLRAVEVGRYYLPSACRCDLATKKQCASQLDDVNNAAMQLMPLNLGHPLADLNPMASKGSPILDESASELGIESFRRRACAKASTGKADEIGRPDAMLKDFPCAA